LASGTIFEHRDLSRRKGQKISPTAWPHLAALELEGRLQKAIRRHPILFPQTLAVLFEIIASPLAVGAPIPQLFYS